MSNLLPVGSYIGEIVGHDLTQFGDKKTPAVVVDVRLHRGTDSDRQNVECDGDIKRVVYWLSEKALPYSVKSLAALGYTSTDIDGLCMNQEGESGLVGLEVKISCKHAEDQKGIMRERLGMFPVAPAASPLDKANLVTFGKLFRREQEKLQEEANVSTAMAEDEDEETAPEPTPKKVAPKTPKGGKTYQRSPY